MTGTSRTLDANSVTNGWVDTDPLFPMAPRLQHNLVLLPTGEVLAVGGVTETGNGSTATQECPQLWSPASRKWTALNELACDRIGGTPVIRNYHSTALLLPDARVISAGGWGSHDDRLKARIFCPPYLFKPGVTPAQLAPRPIITSAPTHLTWGQVFTICTPNPAAVEKVALIRSGSTTHSFDQNQRYERLTIRGTASDPPRLFVTAPASRDHAPPGDYLLFLVGSSDGSGSYPEAPSIAEWVRLQGPLGADLCDVVPPDTIGDLTPDVVASNEIWFFWTATADDGVLPASGSAQSFDLRASASPIDSESAWAGAPHLSQDESVPGAIGTWGTGHVAGLTPCTWYHFAVRPKDDNARLSGFHAAVTCRTFDIGCGGGGFSAREARGEADGAAGSLAAQPASATGLEPATGALVVETRRTEDGAWQVLLRFASQADGFDSAAEGIAVEQETERGERVTLGRIAPDESQGLLGIGSLRERGRLVIPGVYRLERVMARVRHRAQDYVLDAALHSRLGALAGDVLTGGGSPDLQPGDWLSLRYVPVEERLSDARGWYLAVRRAGSGEPIPMASRPSVDRASLPTRYALRAGEPNPATGPTLVRFDLPLAGTVQLEVFDLLGRRVATLAEGVYPAGSHARVWDLQGVDGTPVRPGVYVYRMRAGQFSASHKISVVP